MQHQRTSLEPWEASRSQCFNVAKACSVGFRLGLQGGGMKQVVGAVSATGAGALLVVTREAVDKHRRQGRPIVVPPEGGHAYPRCQSGSE